MCPIGASVQGFPASPAGWAGFAFAATLFASTFVPPAMAEGYRLAPYKDELFRIHVVQALHDGDYVFAEFSKERDLYGRDEVVEKKAFAKFVSLEPNATQKDLVLPGDSPIKYVGVGKTGGGAKLVVIFLHGDKGSRFQPVDDWSFGGNFNRLKNLVVRNGGVYLAPDFSNFGKKGAADVKALMKAYAANSPGAPIIVACTSRGGELCFHLIEDRETSKLLGGIVLLGTNSEETFFTTEAFTDPTQRVPIFMSHGSNDKLMSWVTQELFFKKVKAAQPDYPVRLIVFKGGAHGTPMRLTDWRAVINWMLAVKGGVRARRAGPDRRQITR